MKIGFTTLLFIIWGLLQFGCTDNSSSDPVFRYYPDHATFKKGFVNKYYEHYYPTSTSQSASTRIAYFLYQKVDQDAFVIKRYNAGFWLTGIRNYHIAQGQLFLDSSVNIQQTDTTIIEVDKGLLLDFSQEALSDFHYKVQGSYDSYSFTYESQQVGSRDTTINQKPAKVFEERAYRKVMSTDTVENSWMTTSYYVEELGMYGATETFDDFTWEVELVEQMPLHKFEKLANHNEKRVAYIDPAETLDDNPNFQICGNELFIADYYNSTPDGDYRYGKAALVDSILTNLDTEKLMNQTGMLTFRFVVNCNGEAGRFIARGYDYNYQPYEFPDVTVNHLYDQLRRLKEWQQVVIRDEPSDAYFYFTFKLFNGEITDILP